ncbi:MAG: hypothetical protein C4520_07640 [Candidatus Abyssobacteria bacterium SURF_5]|uniref:L-2-amino-thiazoline-4-carboxylic acid hydrolase n=1 Tax=Abyssobacteria bacterium (strain SURF_5) TaxID=2093360 RepID=A0A3A4NQP1_ABYX5|nr:MAG: hypothetical protein C4520_07640 [Candidatus Abyssubacteria bacterium SURF_5]
MKTLDRKELKELLVKCWMTNDGLWFYHSVQEVGIEKTSRINQAAARAIGAIEAKRIARALGVQRIDTFGDLRELMQSGFDVIRGDFMGFSYDWSKENRLHVKTNRCFAYEGIKKIGEDAIGGYDCGIFARVSGWFDGLGIRYEVDPPLKGCMLHREGSCHRDFTFSFSA